MQIHITLKGKPTTVSVDDILFDYFGAWLVDESPELHSKAKTHHDRSKNAIKRICRDPDLPIKNVSQFVQQRIIELIAAPHLKGILEIRGPRYELEKRPRSAPTNEDLAKADEVMKSIQHLV